MSNYLFFYFIHFQNNLFIDENEHLSAQPQAQLFSTGNRCLSGSACPPIANHQRHDGLQFIAKKNKHNISVMLVSLLNLDASPQFAVRNERDFIRIDLGLIPLFLDIAFMNVLQHILIDHVLNVNNLFQ